MIAVSVAINIGEDSMPGSMISIATSETLGQYPPINGDGEALAAVFDAMELHLDTMLEQAKTKAIHQIQINRDLARAGEHPWLAPGVM